MTRKLSSTSNSLVTRFLDSVDRGHARAADKLHTARNSLRDNVLAGLDRIETLLDGARKRIESTDKRAADAIVHAQGVVGTAIEKARMSRTLPQHVAS